MSFRRLCFFTTRFFLDITETSVLIGCPTYLFCKTSRTSYRLNHGHPWFSAVLNQYLFEKMCKNVCWYFGLFLTNFDLCSAAILDILLMLVVVLADKVVFHVLSFDIQMIPFSLGDGSYLQISLWLMFVFQWALIFLLYRTCNLCLFIFEDINQFNYLSSQSSPMVSL